MKPERFYIILFPVFILIVAIIPVSIHLQKINQKRKDKEERIYHENQVYLDTTIKGSAEFPDNQIFSDTLINCHEDSLIKHKR